MAEKRMFSKSIICSDEFLEMPDSTQNLYFHLSMNADDDGFVDKPKGIMRMVGAKDDDLKVLIAKAFVLPFETGIIVIRHWRLNNCIQKDRKKNTLYKNELKMLKLDNNGAYTFGEGKKIDGTEKETKPLTPAQQKRLDAKKESELPYSFEYKIKERFIGKQCPICGKIMTSASKKTQPTIKHNLPISKGGKHEIDNISVICGECNYSIQDNETERLNNAEVKAMWEEIQNGNGTGMDPQYSIGKNSKEKNNNKSKNNSVCNINNSFKNMGNDTHTLLQPIFKVLPDIIIDTETIPSNFNSQLVAEAISKSSKFLSNVKAFSFLIDHYDDIVKGKYDDYGKATDKDKGKSILSYYDLNIIEL